MENIYEQTIKNISSFPALSSVVVDVCKVCQDPDSNIQDLVNIIEKDPGITIDILRTSNSPIYGFTREILSIHQAISLFGMGTIKGFIISSVIRKNLKFDLAPYGISINQYLDTCREYNKFIMDVFKFEDNKVKEVIFPAAFLMNAGTLILSNEVSKSSIDLKEFTKNLKDCGDITQYEKETTGISSIDITAILFEHWNFEIDLIDSIKYITQVPKNSAVLLLSNPLKIALKCVNFYDKYTQKQILDAKKFIKDNLINIDLEVLDKLLVQEEDNDENNDEKKE